MTFGEINPQNKKIWHFEGVRAKKPHKATLLFVDFSRAVDSIYRENTEQILLVYGLPEETVAAIMILYK